MKRKFSFGIACWLLLANAIQAQQAWTRKADFGGGAISAAVGFAIGNKGYIGTGAGTTANNFWEYDPATNAWTQKADFAGESRYEASGFSVDGKGYIGTGLGSSGKSLNDFWQYDPATNAWTQKANVEGGGRLYATGFSIGHKGYIGTGQDENQAQKNDFWEYDPAADTWTRKADYSGTVAFLGTGFSIGNKGYVSATAAREFWEYDPGTNAWTRKADITGAARYIATGFSIGSKGYISTGAAGGSGYLKDLWEYDPADNTWKRKANFGGTERFGAVSFSIGNKGYLGTGQEMIAGNTSSTATADFWEYDPSLDIQGSGAQVPSLHFEPISVSTVAGSTEEGFADAYGTGAKFNYPTAVTSPDASGNIYVSDLINERIRKIGQDGKVTTIAGNGIAGYLDGPGLTAEFTSPKAIALDIKTGNLYVSDELNKKVRKITTSGEVSTFADGTDGLAVDNQSNVYLTNQDAVYKATPAGITALVAGGFPNPLNLAIDTVTGNVYLTQVYSTIQKITPAGEVSTLNPAGFSGFKRGIAADKNGNIYVSVYDGSNSYICKVFASGKWIVLAGGPNGYKDENGISAQFRFPEGIALNSEGSIFVADSRNNIVRKITKPSLHLSSVAGQPSDPQYFIVSGSNLNDDGIITAPPGYEVALAADGPWAATSLLHPADGEIAGVKIYVRLRSHLSAGIYNDSLVLSANAAAIQKIGISGLVAPPPGTGLQAEYFNNTNLAAPSVLTRIDTVINNDFVFKSPATGIVNIENYSVRWSGQVRPQFSEVYTFFALTDDGVRLWVNGTLLIDNWQNQGATEKSGSIALLAGQLYDIEMEYFQGSGFAVSKLLWASAGTAKAIIPTAQLYPPAEGSGTGLRGEYFNNAGLTPPSVLVRTDAVINNDFVFKSPAPGTVNIENYSARWTGQVKPNYSETYTFYAVTDDGVRLWVNGVLLIDNWNHQGTTEKSGSIALQAGQLYDIEMEYFQGSGLAVSKLLWSSASTPKTIIPRAQLYLPASDGTGLQGTYFNNTGLTGAPALTRIDPVINNDFVFKSPAPGTVNIENYSVRWTGQVKPQFSETYTFYTNTDDGVRLWVNNVLLIDNWTNQSATEKSGSIALQAGQKYNIVMEYFQGSGFAVSKLLWSSAGTAKAIVPKTRLFPDLASARMMDAATANLHTPAALPVLNNAGVYPNPVKAGRLAVLQLASSSNGTVIVQLLGSDGAVLRREQQQLVAGVNTILVRTAGLAQGIYLLNITGAGKPVNFKLMVE